MALGGAEAAGLGEGDDAGEATGVDRGEATGLGVVEVTGLDGGEVTKGLDWAAGMEPEVAVSAGDSVTIWAIVPTAPRPKNPRRP